MFANEMAEATCIIGHKRPHECNEEVEEAQKTKRKRKVDEDTCQNQHQCKEKKSRLSAELFGEDCEISHEQVYEFLKYAALGKRHNAAQPSWCRIYHQRHLAKVVVIVLQEVSQLYFYRFYLQFKHLRRAFQHRFSLPPTSANFIASVCGEGISMKHQNSIHGSASASSGRISKNSDLQKDPIIEKYGKEKHGLTSYILTLEEMRKYDYPLEGSPGCENYVHTQCESPRTDSSPLFGLDCEMCLTEKGNEVTRVSVVDAEGQCIMDELIKPETQILNYLTRYSGITRKILLPVKTKLPEIQDKLKKLLPHDAVLVGHSLNVDLHALQMIHPSVIDTSLLFARHKGRRFKLKFLAKAVLGKEIQCENKVGHDPTEDAEAALELLQYFIDQGPRKVVELNLETVLSAPNLMESSQQKSALQLQQNGVQKQSSEPPGILKPCFLDHLNATGQKTLLLSRKELASSGLCQNSLSTLNKQILKRAIQEVPLSSFSVIQFALRSEHVAPDLVAEVCEKMRIQLADMLTVYVGPFDKDFCLKSLRREFKKCGPIQSLTVLTETHQPHICIQYEVLEAAQLAMESLNGADVAGSYIKVQRPVTVMMLDCDMLIKELEMDIENEGVIYVAGLKKTLTETDLQEKFSHLKNLQALFWPRDLKSGKHRNYCFLKFQTSESALEALQDINRQGAEGSRLQSRKALTPSHLHRWICHMDRNDGKPSQLAHHILQVKKEQLSASEQDLRKKLKKLDRNIKKLYRSLENNTLCVILLPGVNSIYGSFSGLGLMGIKEESRSSAC
uniref:RNA exonuclease 5 n=1 Tax=Chrysemys picta bellii TaxID=8478 RepID=A0A8C3I1X3_CHRPI|nr:RNA exonuclease 5 isoform X1 [Chrysemys picta bellii]XP_042709148.1 RNA exonuclease 5 isoform X1 [Chrysemys picta bellii]